MNKIRFAIAGTGWRTMFYVRAAQAMPDRMEICGFLVSGSERSFEIAKNLNIPAYTSLSALADAQAPEFLLLSVSWDATPVLIQEASRMGLPVLTETPPAGDLAGLNALYEKAGDARVLVTEQFPFQPYNAAAIAFAQSGLMGDVYYAHVSVGHGYHGMAVARRLLGLGLELGEICAHQTGGKVIASQNRAGEFPGDVLKDYTQQIAYIEYDGKTVLFDFTNEQYFSFIRRHHLQVRGSRGEINDDSCVYLEDCRTPIPFDFQRVDTGLKGNLEGYYNKGVVGGGTWWYKNPFPGARLSDDELAAATCVLKMHEYVNGAPAYYTLAEGCQDRYTEILIFDSIAQGRKLKMQPQAWHK